MVDILVLVFAMFALRFVPRGVPKKGVISKIRGIPRYVPCKQVPRYVPRYVPRMYHVMCHECATLCATLCALHCPVYIFIGPLLVTAILPRPAAPAPRRPHPLFLPLSGFFTGEWRLFAQKLF